MVAPTQGLSVCTRIKGIGPVRWNSRDLSDAFETTHINAPKLTMAS